MQIIKNHRYSYGVLFGSDEIFVLKRYIIALKSSDIKTIQDLLNFQFKQQLDFIIESLAGVTLGSDIKKHWWSKLIFWS